jgi:hypothetical protein
MLDTIERQWHTATIAAAINGGETEPWSEVRQRFDDWLSDVEQPQSKEDEMMTLLGLRPQDR